MRNSNPAPRKDNKGAEAGETQSFTRRVLVAKRESAFRELAMRWISGSGWEVLPIMLRKMLIAVVNVFQIIFITPRAC